MIRLFFVFLLLVSNPASAAKPEMFFKHLSIVLRGRSPAPAEWNEFSQVKSQDYSSFFSKKFEEYYDPEYAALDLNQRIHELWNIRFVPPNLEPNLWPVEFDLHSASRLVPAVETESVLQNYLTDFVRGNKSWNLLFTGQSYRLKKDGLQAARDADFYQEIFDLRTAPNLKSVTHVQQESTAGIFTTPQFFRRFAAGGNDFERARIEALKNTLTCDATSSTVDFASTSRVRLKDTAFNRKTPVDSRPGVKSRLLTNSGFFINSDTTLGSTTGGELRFFSQEQNKELTLTAGSLNQLLHKMVHQKEYADCQLRRLWSWWARSDRVPSKAAMEHLRREFKNGEVNFRSVLKTTLLTDYQDNVASETADDSARTPLSLSRFFELVKRNFSLSETDFFNCRLTPSQFQTYEHGAIQNLNALEVRLKCLGAIFESEKILVPPSFTEEQWSASLPIEKRHLLTEYIEKIIGPKILSNTRLEEMADALERKIDEPLASKSKPAWSLRLNQAVKSIVLSEEYSKI